MIKRWALQICMVAVALLGGAVRISAYASENPINPLVYAAVAFMGYKMFYEEVETFSGNKKIRRVRTAFLVILGILCIPLGLYLIFAHEIYFGAFLILTLSPCLLLYPLIRFFVFGGKDSFAGVVATVVVEEVIKSKLKKKLKNQPKIIFKV